MTDLYSRMQEKSRFFLLAGPCVIEDISIMRQIAESLKSICLKLNIQLVFKSSWKKANRTSAQSYTGPGLIAGCQILSEIKREFNLPIVTDVHETCEIPEVARIADIIQIPAFLSRQTDLLTAAARSQKIVNIKKGQFMAPEDMKPAAHKVVNAGNNKVLLCERGTSFGYHNLVVDLRSFAVMNSLGFPVIYDVTHSLQKPSIGKTSGGSPQYAAMMAQAALATGMVNGLFIETHPNPPQALSDAGSMINLNQVECLLKNCLNVYRSVNL